MIDFPQLMLAQALLETLRERRVDRVHWSGPLLSLQFSGKDGEELHLALHQDELSLFLSPPLPESREHFQFQDRRHDFTFLPDHLLGARFLGSTPLSGQSLLRLDFEADAILGNTNRLHLFIEFFAGGRAVLCGEDFQVIRASRKGSAQVKPGADYLLGRGEPARPGKFLPPGEDFYENLAGEGKVRGFSPVILQWLRRDEAGPGEIETALDQLLNSSPLWQLHLFPARDFRPGFILPAEAEPEEALPFAEALCLLGRENRSRRRCFEMHREIHRHHTSIGSKAERLQVKLREDLSGAEGGEELRRQADTLAAKLSQAKRGMESIELEDVHEEGRILHIELNSGDGPRKNLDRLYKRAGKAERGLELIRKRLEQCESEIRTSGNLLRKADKLLDEEEEEGLLSLWLPQAPKEPRKKKTPQPESLPFRRFELKGGWQVWVGRNNRENDELTHKAASQKDLWFHAQSVSGSHVLLRMAGHKEVPKHILEETAAIAAWFSKARNSGLVPVIFTEKRYVRKPRKAAPGQALCEREKSLMVRPGLPDRD
ncbi:MAG: NFACT RNA binding domain-containing protein [Candidatus Krumholzibacteria bacterium]|jgi:hypothetical protein|nr:NFACT RNA binding domain-containing protein [Candidatus Krumholzibacteria bacterium]MDP6797228.1 NFACT RNA binding domain-containing protein [Candidatus Krumholzibacteria bacterium]MDP7022389.1 NFACT RNA binding domain-containing protein [Candidatus Krumholzibacteria bacterium]